MGTLASYRQWAELGPVQGALDGPNPDRPTGALSALHARRVADPMRARAEVSGEVRMMSPVERIVGAAVIPAPRLKHERQLVSRVYWVRESVPGVPVELPGMVGPSPMTVPCP